MSPEYQTIMVAAGEASGDMHAASLVQALRRRDPTLRFYGMGGDRLREAGVRLIADAAEMGVVGLTEVCRKLPYIIKVMKQLTASWDVEKPAAVILVDYPDFNLILARRAHKRGIKVFYYISPQVWAWRRGRIESIRRFVDKMAVILPFEESIYRSVGVNADFVGHPLLDMMICPSSQRAAREKIGIPLNGRVVSLLPGSRPGEVARLLPLCLEAARLMREQGQAQFIMPLASTLSQDFVAEIIARYHVPVTVFSQAMYDVLAASDLAIVASGTATLEAALLETPMIVIYRVSRFSYFLGKMFIRVQNISLVNIMAGKTIVTELIQGAANPERIAALATGLLENPEEVARMKLALSGIKSQLGTPGAAERAAGLVVKLLASPLKPTKGP